MSMQESGANFYTPAPVSLSNELVTVWDPELGRTNPSEHKQLKLARSLTRGIVDRDLKPSSNERKYVKYALFFPLLFPSVNLWSFVRNFLTFSFMLSWTCETTTFICELTELEDAGSRILSFMLIVCTIGGFLADWFCPYFVGYYKQLLSFLLHALWKWMRSSWCGSFVSLWCLRRKL